MYGKKLIVPVITIFALLAYVVLSLLIFIDVIASDKPVEIGDKLLYVATALTGMVGGIVAFAFGLPPKRNPTAVGGLDRSKMRTVGDLLLPIKNRRDVSGNDAGNTIDWQKLIGSAYVWSYVVIGFAAIFVWIFDDFPSGFVKNEAAVFLGMILVIVPSFLRRE